LKVNKDVVIAQVYTSHWGSHEWGAIIEEAHKRAVTDLQWSPFEPTQLITCSADNYTNLWDVRNPKKAIRKFRSFTGIYLINSIIYFDFLAPATVLKWNRKNPIYFASSHDREVRIWDTRVKNSKKLLVFIVYTIFRKNHNLTQLLLLMFIILLESIGVMKWKMKFLRVVKTNKSR
jgi:WD40 repeat protein